MLGNFQLAKSDTSLKQINAIFSTARDSSDLVLKVVFLETDKELRIVFLSDAAFTSDADHVSQLGF